MLNIQVYDCFQWTNLTLAKEVKIVPAKTPPFVIIKITNGVESKSFVHLQEGVTKNAYGNLLDRYKVREYCDSIDFKSQEWKLGNPTVCKRRQKTYNQTLPISVQTIPLHTSSKFSPQGWRNRLGLGAQIPPLFERGQLQLCTPRGTVGGRWRRWRWRRRWRTVLQSLH